jgi:hypothetical protein
LARAAPAHARARRGRDRFPRRGLPGGLIAGLGATSICSPPRSARFSPTRAASGCGEGCRSRSSVRPTPASRACSTRSPGARRRSSRRPPARRADVIEVQLDLGGYRSPSRSAGLRELPPRQRVMRRSRAKAFAGAGAAEAGI